ncbi:hypothetical protein SESBI_38551 [Sesbania bispinosa]|nr:hypothetical protein SESBI_38551 [Sesbania bispinosa]
MATKGAQLLQNAAEGSLGNGGKSTKKQSNTEGGCTHCGNKNHTKETCFKIHCYPDWWHEL